jgi:hypothetical protein
VNKGADADAVFVATTNLGGFELMRPSSERNVKLNQIAALIDSRPGDKRGTIIQHPLIDRPLQGDAVATTSPGPLQTSEATPSVDDHTLDALLSGKDIDYFDPLGKRSDGVHYRGPWIAAVQPVSLPQLDRENRATTTDLLVLVQYRWSDVIAPVGELVTTLMSYGGIAVAGILVVIFLLWYLVRRIGDDSRPAGPLNSPALPSGNTETIAAENAM